MEMERLSKRIVIVTQRNQAVIYTVCHVSDETLVDINIVRLSFCSLSTILVLISGYSRLHLQPNALTCGTNSTQRIVLCAGTGFKLREKNLTISKYLPRQVNHMNHNMVYPIIHIRLECAYVNGYLHRTEETYRNSSPRLCNWIRSPSYLISLYMPSGHLTMARSTDLHASASIGLIGVISWMPSVCAVQ